jgi:hypothetical protein
MAQLPVERLRQNILFVEGGSISPITSRADFITRTQGAETRQDEKRKTRGQPRLNEKRNAPV